MFSYYEKYVIGLNMFLIKLILSLSTIHNLSIFLYAVHCVIFIGQINVDKFVLLTMVEL